MTSLLPFLLVLVPVSSNASDEVRPGLVAHYRTFGDPPRGLDRVDPKPALSFNEGSIHPIMPAGPFEVVWRGMLQLQERGPILFDALVSGEITLTIDGEEVLSGAGKGDSGRVLASKPLERRPGSYPFSLRYRSHAGQLARVQLGWSGPTFAREPVPAWRFGHRAGDRPGEFDATERREGGREAAVAYGCAVCHRAAFPSLKEPPPGPSLQDLRGRVSHAWLMDWLENPGRHRPGSSMPQLFTPDRLGEVERRVIAEHLLGKNAEPGPRAQPTGDHRMGRRHFVSVGCTACHFLPDADPKDQAGQGQTPFRTLADRYSAEELTRFLSDPRSRYPDGRMPHLALPANAARDMAAYLLLWSQPTPLSKIVPAPTTPEERNALATRLGNPTDLGPALLKAKGCVACHPGLLPGPSLEIPIVQYDRGCLSSEGRVRFALPPATRSALGAFLTVASKETHPSPFTDRQNTLKRAGCVRCHQRDSDRLSPLETMGSTLGGAWLQNVPPQRAPRLTFPHQKFTLSHLHSALREGVQGLRYSRYSYLMPSYGAEAASLVQALAEADGEGEQPAEPPPSSDRTLGPLAGVQLAGFQGYACVSCHVWKGQHLSEPDPGARGSELTRLQGRIRRDWFDRYLEGPARFHPGTPMPTIFTRGQAAPLSTVLDGDAGRQKEALWSYFALGKEAPSPKPPAPLPITALAASEPPLVAQIPLRINSPQSIESLTILFANHNLVAYDLGLGDLHSVHTGAQLLRSVQGRLRTYAVDAKSSTPLARRHPVLLKGKGDPESLKERILEGYDRLRDGARLRWRWVFPTATITLSESLRLEEQGKNLVREIRMEALPTGHTIAAFGTSTDGRTPLVLRTALPTAQLPPPYEKALLPDPGLVGGSLQRPGYRAIAYPRVRTITGEDLIMPGAVAADPRDGRVFVASLKTGGIYLLQDPTEDGHQARFEDYTGGLFQDAYSLHAEPGELYVLHRRNLTRVTESTGVGRADRFDRVALLPHSVADSYDYPYGLARDRSGAFVLGFAPYASRHLPGSGGAARLERSGQLTAVAYGMRNPVGWCTGIDGDVYFTDNQGEWVPTNKLCHVEEGRYYGFPNPEQRQHSKQPTAPTAVWIPYGWAKSINGVTCDRTGGKFGPFAGQFFLAELMFGGALVRADVERVKGTVQGVCFPFWGQGLMGPLTLAFDPRGRLFVGSITEPGWMAQPDRGAMFRIDFTGDIPFEIRTIRVLPRGFRLHFTRPATLETAKPIASYRVESYRYERTGAYGSPELDRTESKILRADVSQDGLTVDLTLDTLIRDRVYRIRAEGVRSPSAEPLVHPEGAYTLNEIPSEK